MPQFCLNTVGVQKQSAKILCFFKQFRNFGVNFYFSGKYTTPRQNRTIGNFSEKKYK